MIGDTNKMDEGAEEEYSDCNDYDVGTELMLEVECDTR